MQICNYLSAIADSGKTHLSHEEFEEFANSKIQKQEISGLWLCTLCGQTSGNSTHLKRHIEARHVILPPLICYICQKPSKTSHSMRMHMKYQHNVVGSVFYRVSSKTVPTLLFALLMASTCANCKSWDIFLKFRKFAT